MALNTSDAVVHKAGGKIIIYTFVENVFFFFFKCLFWGQDWLLVETEGKSQSEHEREMINSELHY